MISFSKINPIGYGLGFGGTNAKNVEYTNKHKEALNFLIKNKLYNFIDTSPEYGNGKSEILIGSLPKKIKKELFISTKVSPENLNYNNFIKSVYMSLKRLDIDRVDVIQPHWPNYNVSNDEIISSFRFLKKKNKVRYFGLSNFELIDIKYFKNKMKSDFKFLQEEYSLIDKSIEEEKIKYCINNNIKIICYSPLSSGNFLFNRSQKSLLSALSDKYQEPFSSIILNYLIQKSNNLILIPHSTNIENISSNLNATNFILAKRDILRLNNQFKVNKIKIKLKNIIYYDQSYKKITNLSEAIKNKFNLSPSPNQLSKKIIQGAKLKPIKVRKRGKKFYLVEGRLRFWAYVIAYGWDYSINAILKNQINKNNLK
jgi:diketogulonate reductase-like aldo/keto reductase